jgi:hypothetical protein
VEPVTVATAKATNVGIVIHEGGFRKEGVSKSSGGFIRFLSLVTSYAKAMTYQKAEQQCCEREKWIGKNLNCESYHYADLTVFFVLEFLIAMVVPILWESRPRFYFLRSLHNKISDARGEEHVLKNPTG